MRPSKSLNDRQAETATRFLRTLIQKHRMRGRPKLAVILGSGLGNFTDSLAVECTVLYESIPYFPTPSVAGHPGSLALVRDGRRWMICLEGRSHLYEGHPIHAITFPVRVLGRLGIKQLVVTNAAGGLNPRFSSGDFMLISDHISSFIPNPLVGSRWEDKGARFPDMSQCYSIRFRQIARRCARQFKLKLREGVYLAVSGPSYETPAEIRLFRKIGGDAIGMSTVPEIIMARQMGLECLGISLITNLAAGMSRVPISHAEVLSMAEQRKSELFAWLKCVCSEILRLE